MIRRLLVPVVSALATGAGAALLCFVLEPRPTRLLPVGTIHVWPAIFWPVVRYSPVPLDQLIVTLSLSFLAAFAVFRLCRRHR
jgi:hypothetical protein